MESQAKLPKCESGDIRQRWSPRGRPWPRGQILKSLASKVKSLALASRPQVLENWPVLGSRTALFFELLKFCRALEKIFGKRFLWRLLEKFLWRPFFFFWRALALVSLVLGLGLEHSCPWPRECLSSKRLSLALASDFFVSLALASSLVSSTPPLIYDVNDNLRNHQHDHCYTIGIITSQFINHHQFVDLF